MAFKIIVCAKQVPDTNEIKIDPVTKTLMREGVPSILNHDDANALEEALKIKDKYPDTHITVVTMGPPQAKDMLIECLAMGADEAILASDRALGGSDTWATSNAVAAVIGNLCKASGGAYCAVDGATEGSGHGETGSAAQGGYDLIFAGRQAIDGDTAQVGPQIAEKLGIPQVTYVQEFEIAEDMKHITVKRALEDGYELIEIETPCMLTAIKELNTPRYMSIRGIFEACRKEIPVWTAEYLGVDTEAEVGLDASPTKVYRSFTPAPKGKGEMISGDTDNDLAKELIIGLKSKHVI